MKARITKRLLDRLELPEGRKQLIVHDTELPGFSAVLGARGIAFAASYRVNGRRVRGQVVGHYGPLTIAQGREQVRKRIAEAKWGVRPDVRVADHGPTFGELTDAFLVYAERHRKSHVKDRYRVKRHLSAWRSWRAQTITRADVLDLARSIGDGGAPVEANRVASTIQRIYSLAEEAGAIPAGTNPANRLGRYLYREDKRHDRSLLPDEVRRLVPPIWKQPNPLTRATFWLLLLTGLRRSECHWLEWARVNLGDKLRIMPGRHKLPGRSLWLPENKADRPVALPLSSASVGILESLPRDSRWVFPGRGGPLRKVDHQWQRTRKQAGCPELTLHDLRASCATWMARSGVNDRIIAQCLNQLPPSGVLSRYVDDTPGRVREALEAHGRAVIEAAGVQSALDLVWPAEGSTGRILRFSA